MFRLLIALGCIGFGGQGIYNAATAGQERTIDCDAYALAPDQESSWVSLRGCRLDLSAAVVHGELVRDLYIPVHTASGLSRSLVVHTYRGDWVTEWENLAAAAKGGDAAAASYLERNSSRLQFRYDVSGVVETGLDVDSDATDFVRETFDLKPEAIVIREGESPSWLTGGAFLVAGVLLAAGPLLLGMVTGQADSDA